MVQKQSKTIAYLRVSSIDQDIEKNKVSIFFDRKDLKEIK
jgi:hypothetical protein